jgi:polyphosphate kinase
MPAQNEVQFLNRELSWLEFNQRVLNEATDPEIPLLERLRFLAITASNLDEFFMVRVGGLQQLAAAGIQKRDPAGLTPKKQLAAISKRTRDLTQAQYECYLKQIEPEFQSAGIQRLTPDELDADQSQVVQSIFMDEVLSSLAPMAVSSKTFPLLINQSISMCVRLATKPDTQAPDLVNPSSVNGNDSSSIESDETNAEENADRYAVIPFGRFPMRFVTIPADKYSFVLLEEIVAQNVGQFFPNETIQECVAFRITRNADMAVREDLASDLLNQMQQLLSARKEGGCVRLEIASSGSKQMTAFLQETLQVDNRDVYRIPGPLDLSGFMQLTETGVASDALYESWPAQHSPAVDQVDSIFDSIARDDIVLYHPYESFEPVMRLVDEAADDPDVIAIKQILYRTSRNSPIVKALSRAAQNGKHVTVIVELKARFDEQRNIAWARSLEQDGVQVFYGVKGLKTHAKICIVVRREPQGIQRYCHFGTGNYNESTARLYSDVSLLTVNEELGADAVMFFNAVTGFSSAQPFRKLASAPRGMRDRLKEMIEAEIQFRKQRQRAAIVAKLNSLVDPEIIEMLYRASQAGVRIRLNVRGICCLIPGIPGLSENIEVVSVIDRFLEHARILYFRHGGDDRVFISSADWMPRNLDRRVELLVPIEDSACRDRLIEILECYFKDRLKGWQLQADGSYERPVRKSNSLKTSSQEFLYDAALQRAERNQKKQEILEPHRAPDAK